MSKSPSSKLAIFSSSFVILLIIIGGLVHIFSEKKVERTLAHRNLLCADKIPNSHSKSTDCGSTIRASFNPTQHPEQLGVDRYQVISKDGKHTAEVVKATDGSNYYVLHDGKAGQEFISVSKPQFSSDGQFMVYLAKSNDSNEANPLWKVVVNENTTPVALENTVSEPQFEKDGSYISYTVSALVDAPISSTGSTEIIGKAPEETYYTIVEKLAFK